ncbi:transglycosylase domain-containing protein [Caldimonas sp. KR1-144]|uniref:transglycosylase domain-containing protein n=1 Tax=Caldimonas sp. KR1-144 TaxID=3400911 RepID=UPI003C1136A8
MPRAAKYLAAVLLGIGALVAVSLGAFEFIVMRPMVAEARAALASASPAELHPVDPMRRMVEVAYGESLSVRVAGYLSMRTQTSRSREPNIHRVFIQFVAGRLLPVHLTQAELTALLLALAPMGVGVQGFAAASQVYLRVPLSDVTLVQAATLAAIAQAPGYYLARPQRLATRSQALLAKVHQ